MKLKGRLKLIADKIPECNVLCDIGTDHGYIPVYAVLNNLCRKAIACDVKKGPLQFAKENIRKYDLEKIIEVRCGDGLEPIRADEADVIIIAGMGGTLIKNILNKGIEKAKAVKSLIIQPMNSLDEVRRWLYSNSFEIADEELVNEGEKIYNVIMANWTGVRNSVREVDYHIGRKLVEKKDRLLPKLLERKIKQTQHILSQMENKSVKDASKNLGNDIDKEIKKIDDKEADKDIYKNDLCDDIKKDLIYMLNNYKKMLDSLED